MFISSPAARYSISAIAGIVMTSAIFFLMYRLIGSGPLKVNTDELFAQVTLYQAPPEKTAKPPVPPAEPERKAVLEPEMSPLSQSAPAATQTLNLPGPPISTAAPAMGDITIASGSGAILGIGAGGSELPGTWTAPGDDKLAKKIAAADAKGANGYREITPVSTRQPNVPEIAWKNKINGWVLVAFTVNTKGFVENVRVLDAQPRGVFEENVIASVKNWVYSPADFGGKKVKAQLTQKIELFYKDYPNNNKQLQ
jgi:periplasmic protein TonB